MDVEFLLCVNNSNGVFIGSVSRIDVIVEGELVLELEARKDVIFGFYRLNFRPYILIAGQSYPIKTYRTQVGNICWDSTSLDKENAIELLNNLIRSEDWHILAGIGSLYDRFYDKQLVVLKDIDEYDRKNRKRKNDGKRNSSD